MKKDEKKFSIGDTADELYIIISGELKTIKIEQKKMELNLEQYILKLKQLKDNMDFFLQKKSLNFNKDKLDIDISKFEEFEEAYFRNRLKNKLRK